MNVFLVFQPKLQLTTGLGLSTPFCHENHWGWGHLLLFTALFDEKLEKKYSPATVGNNRCQQPIVHPAHLTAALHSGTTKNAPE